MTFLYLMVGKRAKDMSDGYCRLWTSTVWELMRYLPQTLRVMDNGPQWPKLTSP